MPSPAVSARADGGDQFLRVLLADTAAGPQVTVRDGLQQRVQLTGLVQDNLRSRSAPDDIRPNDHGDRPPVTSDRDLLALGDPIKDLGKGGSSLTYRHHSHKQNVRRCTSMCKSPRPRYALSSRSSGVRNRGVTRFAPSQASSLAAWPETAAAPSAPMSSSSRTTTSPDPCCAQPPTTRPSHQTVGPMLPVRSNSAARCGPRNQSRACHPIGVGSSARSSEATAGTPAGASRSSASATAGCPPSPT